MSDEIRKFLERDAELRRALDPLGDLRRIADPLREAYKSIGPATEAARRLEESAVRKLYTPELGASGLSALLALKADALRGSDLAKEQFEAVRRLSLGTATSELEKAVSRAVEAQRTFEKLFRMPVADEIARLMAAGSGTGAAASLAFRGRDDVVALKASMEAMRSPWVNTAEVEGSARAFAEVQGIGRLIQQADPFAPEITKRLRIDLGDWRDWTPADVPALADPLYRMELYVERGFDFDLTSFPQAAFDDSLVLAGLVETDAGDAVLEHHDGDARAERAYATLRRFEIAVRAFIAEAMSLAFGDHWYKVRLPPNMLDRWLEARERALADGRPEEPIVAYADFTDYAAIIERRDNWKEVFKPVFGRPTDIQESFVRLFPVRNGAMHARIVTSEDALLLAVEVSRIMRAIDGWRARGNRRLGLE